ncbi:unnamed protein product [Hydatigera taeniaeformis]|uniref:Trichohyalin-like n=1 Tax=Hydatigena taeniaeformis TaxID=6205 RepID=A0A0R3X4W0_HYDTA|nr:unnamed protein product [Hydatigera taeniaeformis]
MNKAVEAMDGEKEMPKVETEVKKEDQGQEGIIREGNSELPGCNEGGDEEVAAFGIAVDGKGSDEGAEASQDNNHCQEAEKTRINVSEKVLKTVILANDGEETDSDDADKIYATKQDEKAERILKEEKMRGEEQKIGQMKGENGESRVSKNARVEKNKDHTNKLKEAKDNDTKKEAEKDNRVKIKENEKAETMDVSIRAAEMAKEEDCEGDINGTAKGSKLLEETGTGLKEKELKVSGNENEQKKAVAVSTEIEEKIVDEAEFIEKTDAVTPKGQPNEDKLDKADVVGTSSNQKSGSASIEVDWTKVMESTWKRGETKGGEVKTDLEPSRRDVQAKETKVKKREICIETQADIEIDEEPVFELEEEERKEVEEGNLRDLHLGVQSKRDIRDQDGIVEGVSNGTMEQYEFKVNKACKKFMLPEDPRTAEGVLNKPEEVESQNNSDLV